MWILGIIAASLATTLLALLIKGGIRLVGAVLTTITSAIIDAVFLVLQGAIWAVAWTAVQIILFTKFIYRKITTKKTNVSDDANFDWMRAAQRRDDSTTLRRPSTDDGGGPSSCLDQYAAGCPAVGGSTGAGSSVFTAGFLAGMSTRRSCEVSSKVFATSARVRPS